MNKAVADYRAVQKWSPSMGGVFSLSDLKNLFDERNPVLLNRRITALIEAGALRRFIRQFYAAEKCSLEILSQRIYPDSCLSLGTVLARRLLIGSVPAKTVYAVKAGRNRTFTSAAGRLVYLGIAPRLLFGCEYEKGVRYASPEKAFIDTLYYYQKGFRFSFNPLEDIDVSRLEKKKVYEMLARYKNPRFVTFVKGALGGGHS